jgi:hypothetical protein
MNSLLWIAQISLAAVFLFAGFSKTFLQKRRVNGLQPATHSGYLALPDGVAAAVVMLECVGALGLVMPVNLGRPEILPLLAASELALLAVAACIYHLRRQEPTAPIVAVFLLAVFVIVGRWPR